MAVTAHNDIDVPPTGQLLEAGIFMPAAELSISGITADEGFFVPMHITQYGQVSRNPKSGTASVIPIIAGDNNTAIGGSIVLQGVSELAKLTVEGHIDTPTEDVNSWQLPTIQVEGIRMHYPDIIAMYIEGRARTTDDGFWKRTDPLWFRDPFSRVYRRPKIVDFSAGYVEAVPGRTTFQMKLVVNSGRQR